MGCGRSHLKIYEGESEGHLHFHGPLVESKSSAHSLLIAIDQTNQFNQSQQQTIVNKEIVAVIAKEKEEKISNIVSSNIPSPSSPSSSGPNPNESPDLHSQSTHLYFLEKNQDNTKTLIHYTQDQLIAGINFFFLFSPLIHFISLVE